MDDQNCDCCEGTQVLTPASVANRPGLSTLAYRVGTHARFLETMKARLANMVVEIPNPDDPAKPTKTYPLSALTTRAANDPALALLDGWATVADVLTFYQERIANEGFLRTATERRSVLELARLIGYALRPGVAASAFLALELDKDHEVLIQPHEIKAQTVPGPGELPQTFETSEVIETRAEWNNLKPRISKPQVITLANAQIINPVFFEDAALNLKLGDRILFVFGDEIGKQVVRQVKEATAQFEDNRTAVELQEVPFLVIAAVTLLRTALAALDLELSKLEPRILAQIEPLVTPFRDLLYKTLENALLGNYPPLNADFFSHDRIYNFLATSSGLESLRKTVPLDEMNNVFARARETDAGRRGAVAESTGSVGVEPGPQDLYINVATAVLDEALELLQVTAFRHELACLASSVIKQARPVSRQDKLFVTTLLARLTEKDSLKSLSTNFGILPSAVSSSSELSNKLATILRVFTQLIGSANVYDNLSLLLDDLLELSRDSSRARGVIQQAQNWLKAIPRGYAIRCGPVTTTTSLDELVSPLAKLPSLQPTSSAHLARSMRTAFSKGADNIPKVLISLTPRLRETFYLAWANAAVNSATSALKSVQVLRAEAAPFGYNAPVKMGLKVNETDTKKDFPYLSQPDGDWAPSEASDERPDVLYLDTANNAILPQTYILIHNKSTGTMLVRVNAALSRPRTAYSISGKTTQLTLSRNWWKPADDSMAAIRNTVVAAQSEELFLVDKPYIADIQGKTIELNGIYNGLTTGRWLIVSGERTDIESTTGVKANELVMIAGIEQHYKENLPGDKTHTIITLANSLAYRYKRDTAVIYGNVVKATHGETRKETLGGGDASQAFQSFALKQAPLTFVSSPTPAGVESTLEVYVNDVRWHESDSLTGLAPTDRKFVIKTDDAGKTTIIFGNGQSGARLPTAPGNIRAEYRNGIGRPGNVQAEQISLLMAKPLGVQSVINPLRASGGADRESRDIARKNAPRTVNALDRLVSVTDYADFARTFAGIGKSAAAQISDGQRQMVHVTIAGADDIPIDETSDLFTNLRLALLNYGDPDLPIALQVRELLLLVLSANVSILPDYQWDQVAKAVRTKLLDTFSFERRELGQDVLLSEVIASIQAVRGVDYVDVDVLGGVPEKKPDKDNHGRPIRRLLTPQEIAEEAKLFIDESEKTSRPEARVRVNLADFEMGALRPAQLAYLTPDVTDTLVLNQVK